MKRLLLGGIFLACMAGPAWMAEGSFSSTISPGDFDAAGLRKLSPEQLARLNALVEAYRTGTVTLPPRVAKATSLPPRTEVSAAASEAPKAKAAEPAPRPGLISQAKGLLKPKSPPREEPPALESTLVGKFNGWQPKQIFTLASGERVQIANRESYYTPVMENPKVQLNRAALAGYWLRFPDLNVQVRVNLLDAR